MKFIKWKILIISCMVCLLPILLGVLLWDKLPETLAIHFDINNNPDNFASKEFVVFGLPCIMVLLQSIACISGDFNAKKHGEEKKFDLIVKWIIPVLSIILQILTIGIGLGWNMDVRRFAVILTGIVLILTGNYMPKLNYVKNYKLETEKAKKVNRFLGFATVIMGALFIISVFLPPIASAVCIALFIPYTITGIIYAIKVKRS